MLTYSLYENTTKPMFPAPPVEVILSGRLPNINGMYTQWSSQAGIPFGPIRPPNSELLTPEVARFGGFRYFERKNDCSSMTHGELRVAKGIKSRVR